MVITSTIAGNIEAASGAIAAAAFIVAMVLYLVNCFLEDDRLDGWPQTLAYIAGASVCMMYIMVFLRSVVHNTENLYVYDLAGALVIIMISAFALRMVISRIWKSRTSG